MFNNLVSFINNSSSYFWTCNYCDGKCIFMVNFQTYPLTGLQMHFLNIEILTLLAVTGMC